MSPVGESPELVSSAQSSIRCCRVRVRPSLRRHTRQHPFRPTGVRDTVNPHQVSAPRFPNLHNLGARHPADVPLASLAPSARLVTSSALGSSLEDVAFPGAVHQGGINDRFKNSNEVLRTTMSEFLIFESRRSCSSTSKAGTCSCPLTAASKSH